MEKKLLKFESFVNEDLASKARFDIGEENIQEDDFVKEINDKDIDLKIEEIQDALEDYEPNFIYSNYEVDSQIENAGIVKSTVWIEFLDVTNPEQYDYDDLEEDFLSETDFDEVEILTTDNSITYSINIYDYDNR
jgi:aconitase A